MCSYEVAMFNAIRSKSLDHVKRVRETYPDAHIDPYPECLLAAYVGSLEIYDYVNTDHKHYEFDNLFICNDKLDRVNMEDIVFYDLICFHKAPVDVMRKCLQHRPDLIKELLLSLCHCCYMDAYNDWKKVYPLARFNDDDIISDQPLFYLNAVLDLYEKYHKHYHFRNHNIRFMDSIIDWIHADREMLNYEFIVEHLNTYDFDDLISELIECINDGDLK